MAKFGIFASDGTPCVVEALDTKTNKLVQAETFTSRELAESVMTEVDQEVVNRHGKLEVREIIES
jgi:hypothetical protein